MANKPNKRPRRIVQEVEDHMEELEEFYEFKRNIVPELRKMLLTGAKDVDIIRSYTPHMMARLVSMALANPDDSKALAGIKECLDRVMGKSTEHKKIDHQFSNLSDEQLDALIKTELQDAALDDTKQ